MESKINAIYSYFQKVVDLTKEKLKFLSENDIIVLYNLIFNNENNCVSKELYKYVGLYYQKSGNIESAINNN